MMMFKKEELSEILGDWKPLIPYHILIKAIETIEVTADKNTPIYPKRADVFKAFQLCQFKDLKVVILGQDPYHAPGQATGLAFSINPEGLGRVPPSLVNIIKEVGDDVGGIPPNNKLADVYDLTRWAKQGVLLLNTALTVKQATPESHLFIWLKFTETLIQNLSNYHTGIIYVLWGKKAQYFKKFINPDTNHILEAGHPSPLNSKNDFKGCKHFSQINNILASQDLQKINW